MQVQFQKHSDVLLREAKWKNDLNGSKVGDMVRVQNAGIMHTLPPKFPYFGEESTYCWSPWFVLSMGYNTYTHGNV